MIFEEQISRKPDLYPWTSQFIEAMQNGFWTHREFNFNSDVQDFKVNLNDQEREIVVRSLALIGQIEVSVKKFWAKIGDNLPHPSIQDMGYVMAYIEVIHNAAYERLLSVLGLEEAFEEILQLDIIKGRVNYLKKHLHKFHADNRKQFIYSLVLFTLFIENVALFSQFYTVMWFGRFKNVLKDTNKQVEYTSREEDLHAKGGIRLIQELRKEHPEYFDEELNDKITHEAEQMLKYESEVSKWLLGDFYHENLHSELVDNLSKHRMNQGLIDAGFKSVFEIDKDLLKKTNWFDEQLLGNSMTDFFHSRPTEYSKKDKSFDEDDLF